MTTQNTSNDNDETFTRTSPPLNRIVVKLGGPAPWEILTAYHARLIADHHEYEGNRDTAATLREYADAVDAMSKKE